MALLARHTFLLLVLVASRTAGLQTIHVGARALYPSLLRPVEFKGSDDAPFRKDTPLGGHARGLTDAINGPKSPLSLFGKTDDGLLKFKALPKKKKAAPSPSPSSPRTPSPTPSPKSKKKLEKNKKKNEGGKNIETKKDGSKMKTKNNEKKVVKKKKTSTISDVELEQLRKAAIQREFRRHKEELQRQKKAEARKKKRQQQQKKKKTKTKKGDRGKVELAPKKKKIKGGRDYKCTPGRKICAKGFWCVGKKGDMVCRRPKAPYESCRGVKDRCQIGSVCKKGICVVKYKKKTEIFEPEEASVFKTKTAGDILGH